MKMEKRDVVIVGAGPAGLTAAKVLALNAKDVLVVEAKKTIGDKVCAGGITSHVLELGIPKSILQRQFKRVFFHTPHKTTEVKLDKPVVMTIDRKDFGKWMSKKAKMFGAEIRTNSRVTKVNKDYVVVNGKKIGFNYLIGADGPVSIVRKYLGIKEKKILEAWHYIIPKRFRNLEIFFDVDKFGPGYVWIFPHKKTTSIGTGGDLTYNMKMSEIKKNFDLWCKEKKIDTSKAVFQACPINYDYRGYEFENIFLAGEAAGFTSGATGEGIYFAMLSGIDIAKKIVNPKYKCRNIKHVLKVKSFEDKLLRMLEINKILTKLEYNLLVSLVKSKWISKRLVKILD